MKTPALSLAIAYCLLATVKLFGADQPSLDPHLEPLRPLLGKSWKGTFENSKADRPVVDVMQWERALNGKAVRILHSINDGDYGGETIIQWDERKQSLAYHYFPTAGFSTVGTMTVKDGKITSHESVEGSAGGVTEVRATSELLPDETVHVKAEYLKDDKWQPGHEATYHSDPAAKVIFK
jgi:hypothetical protein